MWVVRSIYEKAEYILEKLLLVSALLNKLKIVNNPAKNRTGTVNC